MVVYQNVRKSFSKPHRCIPAGQELCSYPQFTVHKRQSAHISGRMGKRKRMRKWAGYVHGENRASIAREERTKGEVREGVQKKKSGHMAF